MERGKREENKMEEEKDENRMEVRGEEKTNGRNEKRTR